jgi:hypothetical protein
LADAVVVVNRRIGWSPLSGRSDDREPDIGDWALPF